MQIEKQAIMLMLEHYSLLFYYKLRLTKTLVFNKVGTCHVSRLLQSHDVKN